MLQRDRISILYRYMCVSTYRDRETKKRKITHRICKNKTFNFQFKIQMSMFDTNF